MEKIEFNETEFQKLKQLLADFNSYYETEAVWNFQDLDNQREIALQVVQILNNKIN
jgi:hypothetical protein